MATSLEEFRRLQQLQKTDPKEALRQAREFDIKEAQAGRSTAGKRLETTGQVTPGGIRQPVTGQPQLPQQPTPEELQKQLFEQQQLARVAGLTKAKEAGLSALRGEEREIAPAFAGARSGVRATSERGAQQFADFMARRGLTRGGGAALGETQRLGAQQEALGGLAQQETGALSDIARRRAGIEAGFASDVEAARAGLQAQQLQQQIAGQQSTEAARVAAQQQAFENALKLAGITGEVEGVPTLAGARQTFEQEQATKKFEEQKRQFDDTLDQRTKEFEARNELDATKQTFAETQAVIRNGISQGQLSVSQGNALLAKQKFLAENDPTSPEFTQRQEALRQQEALKTTIEPTAAETTKQLQTASKPYLDYVKSNYLTPEQLENYLNNLELQGVPLEVIKNIAQVSGFAID